MKKRIIIIVSGGVADWTCDPGVEVLLIDTDNLDADGGTLSPADIEGFEDLVPEWINADYVVDNED